MKKGQHISSPFERKMKYSHVILVSGPLKWACHFGRAYETDEKKKSRHIKQQMEMKSSLITMFRTIMKDVTPTVMTNNNNKITREWKAKERKNTTNSKPQCLCISVKQITRITAHLNWKRNLYTLPQTLYFIRMAINLQVFLFMVLRVFAFKCFTFFYGLKTCHKRWKKKKDKTPKHITGPICIGEPMHDARV